LYSFFRIHLVRLPSQKHIVFVFSHTLGPDPFAEAHCIRFFAYIWSGYLRGSTLYSFFRIHWVRIPSWRHIVFVFSYTLGPVAFAEAHCIRFFAYIGSGSLRGGTLYSVFRIHWVRIPSRRHIVFGFSHTLSPVTFAEAHCIRFFAYIGSGYPLAHFRRHQGH
jgi:hypothetical protein